jgi:hypothetical protein
MGLFSRITMVAAVAGALVTGAVAQTADSALPQGVEWAVSPAAVLKKLGWGHVGTQGDVGKGSATLTCNYDARGVLEKCHAINEFPVGFAFGNSAVGLSKRMKLKPTLSDGSSLTPGTITFEVAFRDEDRVRNRVGGSGLATYNQTRR